MSGTTAVSNLLYAFVTNARESVLPLVFGCEQLGGHAWGDVDIAGVERAVLEAVDSGVRIFDTADVYGLGESEARLGRLLAGKREQVFIATKFGVRFGPEGRRFNDTSAAWCRESLFQSLRRLQTDYIDLYQLHCGDGRTPLEETFCELARLRAEGRIRAFGVCNLTNDELGSVPDGCISFSREYSLVNRNHEADALRALERGMYFLPYGVLAQGLLAGKHRGTSTLAANDRRLSPRYVNFHGDRLSKGLQVVELLRAHAARIESRPASVAIAWARALDPRTLPIVGIKSSEQLTDAIQGATLVLDASTIGQLGDSANV